MNKNGIVIWEGASSWDGAPIVLIATGLTTDSANAKTGAMVQTFILRQDERPTEALKTGADASICGDCPHRPKVVLDPKGREKTVRSCYVNVGQSVNGVYDCYVTDGYERVTPEEAARLMAGREVRMGAYGDPAMLPIEVWLPIVAVANFNTGYTHQWDKIDPAWSGFLMASCDSEAEHKRARAAGWRGFVVTAKGAKAPEGAVLCMSDRERNPLQCIDCGACGGTRMGSKPNAISIYIEAHGSGAKYVSA
jgi:hypothetical protein